MAYTGFFDAISLALAVQLLVLALSAGLTDYWHPQFYQDAVSPNLVLIMGLVFMAMLIAIVNLIALCLALFVTEAARNIPVVMSGSCAFIYALVLLLFSSNLVCLTSPWLLVMLTTPMAVLIAHQVLILLQKLPSCPAYQSALSGAAFLASLLCISVKHWWVVDPRTRGLNLAITVGLFELPNTASASVLQACAIIVLVCLLALLALNFATLSIAKGWLTLSSPLSNTLTGYISIGLAAASLLCACVASIAYGSLAHYAGSMLAAAGLGASVTCLVYLLIGSDTLTLQ